MYGVEYDEDPIEVGDVVEVTYNLNAYLFGIITKVIDPDKNKYNILFKDGSTDRIDTERVKIRKTEISFKKLLNNILNKMPKEILK